jgi:hypothetical protein
LNKPGKHLSANNDKKNLINISMRSPRRKNPSESLEIGKNNEENKFKEE